MSDTSNNSPYVFSRGSLQLTAKILKKHAPSLALQVQNILGQPVLPKPDGANDNRMSDCFECNLDSFQVRAVVETMHLTLGTLEQATQADATKTGEMIMVKALTDDWLLLATAMFEKLQNE